MIYTPLPPKGRAVSSGNEKGRSGSSESRGGRYYASTIATTGASSRPRGTMTKQRKKPPIPSQSGQSASVTARAPMSGGLVSSGPSRGGKAGNPGTTTTASSGGRAKAEDGEASVATPGRESKKAPTSTRVLKNYQKWKEQHQERERKIQARATVGQHPRHPLQRRNTVADVEHHTAADAAATAASTSTGSDGLLPQKLSCGYCGRQVNALNLALHEESCRSNKKDLFTTPCVSCGVSGPHCQCWAHKNGLVSKPNCFKGINLFPRRESSPKLQPTSADEKRAKKLSRQIPTPLHMRWVNEPCKLPEIAVYLDRPSSGNFTFKNGAYYMDGGGQGEGEGGIGGGGGEAGGGVGGGDGSSLPPAGAAARRTRRQQGGDETEVWNGDVNGDGSGGGGEEEEGSYEDEDEDDDADGSRYDDDHDDDDDDGDLDDFDRAAAAARAKQMDLDRLRARERAQQLREALRLRDAQRVRHYLEKWITFNKWNVKTMGAIRFDDIPWLPQLTPLGEGLGGGESVSILGAVTDLSSKGAKRAALREAQLRWHPDKWFSKFGSMLDVHDAERIEKGVQSQIMRINALKARISATEGE